MKKTCPKCNKIFTSSTFKYCYECNTKNKDDKPCDFVDDKNDDSKSDDDLDKYHPYIKEKIPKCVRNSVWRLYFKNKITGLCQCCKIEKISYASFHSGHIKSERCQGTTSLDNLKPVCQMCNLSMGTMDMNDFIKKYNMHYKLP